MGALFKAGAALSVLGLILIGVGAYLAMNPSVAEKTTIAEDKRLVWAISGEIGPGRYAYKDFTVPSNAQNPVLEVKLAVLSGGNRDVNLIVRTGGGEQLYKERVAGYVERTIPLLGAGTYRVIVDNSFSLITSKLINGSATLRYQYPMVTEEHAETMGNQLAQAGFYTLAIGIVLALAARLPTIAKKTKEEFQKGLKGED